MQKNEVCAVIVTWNSAGVVERSLPAIAPQVAEVFVVDNGSAPEHFASLLEAVKNYSNVHISRNEENRGIAVALNRGAEEAITKGYQWIVTLDDNGKAAPDMVEKLFTAYEALTPEDQFGIAIVAPNISNLKGPTYPSGSAFLVPTTPTTGQLVKSEAWQKIKGYKEDLFIACADHEFCFRMLAHGYRTLLVPTALLFATAGPKPAIRQLLWKKFVVPHYTPDRYYYMYRNSVYLYLTYWRYVPKWIFKNIVSNILSFIKILLYEEKRLQKIWMIARGNWDGLRGRLGRL